jgi:carboxypeptidase PM20D1
MMHNLRYVVALGAAFIGTSVLASPQPPEAVRKQAREIFQRTIAFRTSIGLGEVPAMAAYLADHFQRAGFPKEDVHVLPLGETASLVVRYRGKGRGRPILLLAHMDVVTAKPEEWERDPFTLIEENGYFFGRGTLDNKQGVTALTSTFLRLKQEGFVPSRDLIIAFTGDEETGMLTAKAGSSMKRPASRSTSPSSAPKKSRRISSSSCTTRAVTAPRRARTMPSTSSPTC